MRILVLMLLLPLLVAGEAPPADRFDRTGPQPGEWLPDVPVTRLDGQVRTLHQESQGLTLLVTSSFTCPKSRSRYESLKALAGRFEHQLRVVLVYVIEAHPVVDVCPYKGVVDVTTDNQRDGILFRQPTTMAERLSLARAFRDHQHIELSIAVDHLENRAWTALGAAPNLALVVAEDGRVLLRQGWYDGAILEGRLREILAKRQNSNAPARAEREQEQMKIQDAVEKLPLGDDPDHLFYRGDPRAVEMVKKFPILARYQSMEAKQPSRWLLQIAAERGHRTHVEALLNASATVDAQTTEPSALHLAARNRHLDVVDVLLTAGATPDLRSPDGTTPIQEAAFAGHRAVVERLQAGGATADLFVAAANGQIDDMRAGLAGDASRAYLTDGLGRTLLMYASANGKQEIVTLLLRAGVDAKGNPHARSSTPLHVASGRGQAAIVTALLAAGVDPDLEVYGIGAPLISAAKNDHLEATAVLLETGAKTAVFDQIGYAPLHYAARNGNAAMVELLLGRGADARLGTQPGYGGCFLWGEPPPLDTALHIATHRRHVAAMRLLVRQPAGVQMVNHKGETALFDLIRHRNQNDDPLRPEALELLLAAGIDLQVEDRSGHTVLDLAIAEGDQDLIAVLQAHHARVGSGVERPVPPLSTGPADVLEVPDK